MNPTDPEDSNRNSEEKQIFPDDMDGKTAKLNSDRSLNPKAADACYNNYTNTIRSSGKTSAAGETSHSQNDDNSYQTPDAPCESENKDFDDEMKKDKDKKHSKETRKSLDRKPKYGDLSVFGQKAGHKKEKNKCLFDTNKVNSDKPAAIRPKPRPIENSEAKSVDKPIENAEAESVDKQIERSLMDAVCNGLGILIDSAKGLLGSMQDFEPPVSPEASVPSEAPASPECTPDLRSKPQKISPISSTPESVLDSNPSACPVQPAVRADQTPLNQQQESKPEIYNNKWGIKVEDSKEFNDNPCLSYDDIRDFITNRQTELVDWLQQLVNSDDKSLPMPFRPTSPEHKNDKFIRVAPEDIKDKNIIFVGDIHGDLLSLTSILKTAGFNPFSDCDNADPNKTIIVLLGDIFDRLPDSFEVFFTVLWCIRKYGNIVWLSGNHDFISYKELSETFSSPTSPSDYTQWLNNPDGASIDKMHPLACQISKLFSQLLDSLPAALYFPDGLFVSHGGFPHPHWYKSVKRWKDFNNCNFVFDFYWKRVHETKRHAVLSPGKGGALGYEDFDSFCNLLRNRFKSPVSAFLRGHDHYPERAKVFNAYKLPVITFNTICCSQDGCDPLNKCGYLTTPVIIKYQPSKEIPCNYVTWEELDAFIDELINKEAAEEAAKLLQAQLAASKETEQKALLDSCSADGESDKPSDADTAPKDGETKEPTETIAIKDYNDGLPDSSSADGESDKPSDADTAPKDGENDEVSDSVEIAENKIQPNINPEINDSTSSEKLTSDESKEESPEELKTTLAEEPGAESISASNACSDPANQDSTISPDDNGPMPIPELVIYRIGITRDLLNNWYPQS